MLSEARGLVGGHAHQLESLKVKHICTVGHLQSKGKGGRWMVAFAGGVVQALFTHL